MTREERAARTAEEIKVGRGLVALSRALDLAAAYGLIVLGVPYDEDTKKHVVRCSIPMGGGVEDEHIEPLDGFPSDELKTKMMLLGKGLR